MVVDDETSLKTAEIRLELNGIIKYGPAWTQLQCHWIVG